MKIIYDISNQKYFFEQNDKQEIDKLNFLLTNNKGDFLNLGVIKNSSKFQGLNLLDSKTSEVFKILDEIKILNQKVEEVIYDGISIKRKYKSFVNSETENIDETNDYRIEDSFFLAPSGGLIYEIKNYIGDIKIDLDIKKQNNFDEWGRNYEIEEDLERGIVYVKYKKTNSKNETEFELYFGIKSQNFIYHLEKKFIETNYSYSKFRGSEFKRYIYRLMNISISNDKKIYIGYGFSKNEVLKQINLIETHNLELKRFELNFLNDNLNKLEYHKKPLIQDISLAYDLSSNSVYRFLIENIKFNNVGRGSFAGYPWFSQMWVRDELVGLRVFINNGEYALVKNKINYYLSLINNETGQIRRLNDNKSDFSVDGVFWLSKRIEDFIFFLNENKLLEKIYSIPELNKIYLKLSKSFHNIMSNFWNSEKELLSVKQGDSWMDTLNTNYTLDIQVQLLSFVSSLSILSSLVNKTEEAKHFLDFEDLLKGKIRETYYENGKLYNDIEKTVINSNIFLAYYFEPSLFLKEDWEKIMDNSLKVLYCDWGGISSLSKKNKNFHNNYTGENNDSYHQGDVWFWINNIAAIVLNDLNEQKFRKQINSILLSSTNDILKYGCIGFASEISSASQQKSEGCFAQFWSSTTYIEMIDNLFKK